MLENKYVRPFNTKEELLKTYSRSRELTESDRKYIKQMNIDKFNTCLDQATLVDCFDIGFFAYLIRH